MGDDLESMLRNQAVETAEAAHQLAKVLGGSDVTVEGLSRLASVMETRLKQFERLGDLLEQEDADDDMHEQLDRLETVWTEMQAMVSNKIKALKPK